ncbi:hypothetical protein GWK47_027490 [Chionoecetes opilio]|uniref:Uncharacterized protein n=1 Tax=Chionoecetes opilio TaxID=41210 RepID=A0A8J8WCA6_CHIOP|nr:hypothetical protein GWK47_027490 [Chionoecetes opilio]
MFAARGPCVMPHYHIVLRSTKVFLLIKNFMQSHPSLGRVRVRETSRHCSSSTSPSCTELGSGTTPRRRLLNPNTSHLSLPLVMSTHKADDSSNTLNGMANGLTPKTPFLIGVAGGTASGKDRIHTCVGERWTKGFTDSIRWTLEHLMKVQHGFRQGRSCLSQLLTHYEKVLQDIHDGDNVDAYISTSPKLLIKLTMGFSPAR